MNTYALSISGMTCGHCVARLTKVLAALPGVTVSDVQVGSARVEWQLDQTSERSLAAAIDQAGFHLDAVAAQ